MAKKLKVDSEGAVEAVSVVPVNDNSAAGMDREECVKLIQKRDEKEWRYAWPYINSVRYAGSGWQMLRIVKGGSDVQPVDCIDDADRTAETVLARRTVEVDDRARAKDAARLRSLNQQEIDNRNPEVQARKFKDLISNLSGGGDVVARALEDSDN